MEEAIKYAGDNRRVIFFCACKFPRACHRHVVARLTLEEAKRIGRRVQIVEWPGGATTRKTIEVKDSAFVAISRGLQNVPLNDRTMPRNHVCLPWGSIVDVASHGEKVPVITGPAKFRRGLWVLPIYKLSEPSASKRHLDRLSEQFRRRNGIRPLENLQIGNRVNSP